MRWRLPLEGFGVVHAVPESGRYPALATLERSMRISTRSTWGKIEISKAAVVSARVAAVA